MGTLPGLQDGLFLLTHPQYAPLIGKGSDWGEGQRSHCGLEWVQGCMRSGDRSQDMVMGAHWEQEGALAGLGKGAMTGN